MSGYERAPSASHSLGRNSISVPFVIAASVLAGVGLLLVLLWLITFNWLYFPGVALVLAGGLMLFDRRAGSDRAE